MVLEGRALKVGDDINTDYIAPGRMKVKTEDFRELAKHLLEDIEPGFYNRIMPGDFIVAGRNFGCGSSREHAPRVIKAAGIAAVLAKSFARLFFRNAINLGLPVAQCDTDEIFDGERLVLDLESGSIHNKTRGVELSIKPLPPVMWEILSDGGLIPHYLAHGGFRL